MSKSFLKCKPINQGFILVKEIIIPNKTDNILYTMKSVIQYNTIKKFLLLSLPIILLFTSQLSAQNGDAERGKGIFNANCAACHKLDKKLIGPPLEGISEKR